MKKLKQILKRFFKPKKKPEEFYNDTYPWWNGQI